MTLFKNLEIESKNFDLPNIINMLRQNTKVLNAENRLIPNIPNNLIFQNSVPKY
tara:strand:+ start:40 stop:201 length:162 start_codon:yes stop_codon:yes gene_type:complete